jgi:hypothetical protein
MRTLVPIVVAIATAASVRLPLSADEPSVRDRLQRAIDVSRQLAAKAHEGIPEGYQWIAPTAIGEDRKLATPMRFPKTDHVKVVTQVRPWSWRYASKICPHFHKAPPELEVWPTGADAEDLRRLLTDEDPTLRAMAAEALATLRQPDDVQRISKLLTDEAEGAPDLAWNHTAGAKFSNAQQAADDVKPTGLDLMRSWHRRTVEAYARRAMELMTGKRVPSKVHQQWWGDESDLDLLSRAVSIGWQKERTDPDVGPAVVASFITRRPILFVVFPFPYDEAGRTKVRQFISNRSRSFRVLGANDCYTVLVSAPPGREAEAARASEKIIRALKLTVPESAIHNPRAAPQRRRSAS